jgi:hypothetical protein
MAIQFVSTDPSKSGENLKARRKNYNLPILQLWYHGDRTTPIHCLISKEVGLYVSTDYATGESRQRFDIDFNHIRQKWNKNHCTPGISIDKSIAPSHVFRTYCLDHGGCEDYLIEMMTTMPVSSKVHSEITSDSTRDHLTLLSFAKKCWPWGLQSKKNFDAFCTEVKLTGSGQKSICYNKFIDVLCDIDASKMINKYNRYELAETAGSAFFTPLPPKTLANTKKHVIIAVPNLFEFN